MFQHPLLKLGYSAFYKSKFVTPLARLSKISLGEKNRNASSIIYRGIDAFQCRLIIIRAARYKPFVGVRYAHRVLNFHKYLR